MDAIPLVPLQVIKMNNNRERLFYLVKTVRFVKGFSMFDVTLYIQAVKRFYAKKLQQMCENDIELASNKNLDSNKIKTILIVSYMLKTVKLMIVIFNLSYTVGMVWLILCEAH